MDSGALPPSFGRVSLTLLAGQIHVNLLGNVHVGEVPALAPETPEEVRRVRETEVRRANRLARKTEIEESRA